MYWVTNKQIDGLLWRCGAIDFCATLVISLRLKEEHWIKIFTIRKWSHLSHVKKRSNSHFDLEIVKNIFFFEVAWNTSIKVEKCTSNALMPCLPPLFIPASLIHWLNKLFFFHFSVNNNSEVLNLHLIFHSHALPSNYKIVELQPNRLGVIFLSAL